MKYFCLSILWVSPSQPHNIYNIITALYLYSYLKIEINLLWMQNSCTISSSILQNSFSKKNIIAKSHMVKNWEYDSYHVHNPLLLEFIAGI